MAPLSISPTITSPALVTGAGMLLGTAAYMSPEQAKGTEADKRSDVWAFGCLLYEMLTGTRAFAGEDVTDTIAAVVRGDPDWNALSHDLPDAVRLLNRRALEKNRAARLPDTSTARFILTETLTFPTATGGAPVHSGRASWIGIAVVATVAAAIVAAWSPDGNGLFYIIGGNVQLFRSPVITQPAFAFGEPESIPKGLYWLDAAADRARRWDVLPDGRFVTVVTAGFVGATQAQVAAERYEIVVNWVEELKQRVPVR